MRIDKTKFGSAMRKLDYRVMILLLLLVSSPSFSEPVPEKEIPQSLTLEQAVDFALQNNPDERIQEEAVQAAKAQYIQARSAALLQVGLTVETDHSANISGGSSAKTGNNAFSTLEASQPLYSFGKLGRAQEIARYNIQYQEAILAQTKQSIIYQVTAAFYAVLLQEELIRVNEESVKTAEEHLKTAQIRFDKGVNTLYDATRAKVDLANRKPNLISAKNDLIKARQNLNQLFNLPPNTALNLLGKLAYQDYSSDLSYAWMIAQENRPDLKSLQLTLKLNESKVRLKTAQYLPEITLGADYTMDHPDYTGSDAADFQTWSANVKLTMPIFDSYNISGQIKEAKANFNQSKLAYEKGKLAAQTEVEQAILEIAKQKELVGASQEAVELAQLALTMGQKSYAIGYATSLDVSDVELSLTTAQTNWATAVNNYLVALAGLKKALGTNGLP